ncbi:MAG: hypothetical protein HC851_08825 [Acaryochloris sp. RU_4_1]|nr:hypothetical protein [Acaryochloris sp. RU_4_1]NJN38173.1 hypothetical protein [Acaryochloridaceae cyanobacterium CSU_3_4]NJR53661.1 hypothetical protein [Acaryochloris sp. CRU_2_0]
MKRQRITCLLALSVVAGATLILGSQPAQAGEQRFSCGESGGVPATMAKTKRGNVPVIKWTSDYFGNSGWSAETRCQKVSERFEAYDKDGTLNYLTTGRMNQQSVICVATTEGGPCSGLLFTLKPGSNPGQTLKQLLGVRVNSRGPLNETSERVYINMKEFLDQAPVDTTLSESAAPSLPQPNVQPTQPQSQSDPSSTTPLSLW